MLAAPLALCGPLTDSLVCCRKHVFAKLGIRCGHYTVALEGD